MIDILVLLSNIRCNIGCTVPFNFFFLKNKITISITLLFLIEAVNNVIDIYRCHFEKFVVSSISKKLDNCINYSVIFNSDGG